MLLICMSIAGTVPLIICLLLLLLQRKKFSYRLGRNLVFLSLVGYLIPFQVVKYLMPEDLLRETDSLMNISYFINFLQRNFTLDVRLDSYGWIMLAVSCKRFQHL